MVLPVYQSITSPKGGGNKSKSKSKQLVGRPLLWLALFAFVSFLFTLTIFSRMENPSAKERKGLVSHLVSFKPNAEKSKANTETETETVTETNADSQHADADADADADAADFASVIPDIDLRMPRRLKPALDSADFPSLLGSTPASLNCAKHNYPTVSQTKTDNLLVYWNEPQGDFDQNYVGKFDRPPMDDANIPPKYVTFEPDNGGWNNIRMSMETVLVFAYATNRIIVMPPKKAFYLVGKEGSKSYDDFFHFDDPEFKKHITIISMEDYLRKEGGGGRRIPRASALLISRMQMQTQMQTQTQTQTCTTTAGNSLRQAASARNRTADSTAKFSTSTSGSRGTRWRYTGPRIALFSGKRKVSERASERKSSRTKLF